VTMILSSPARSDRRLLAGGATLTVFGIAMSTGELDSVAGLLTIGGLLCSIVGLHRFGRTGADQPLGGAREVRREPKKKKRSKQARPAAPRD
jgi:hypothetical protein